MSIAPVKHDAPQEIPDPIELLIKEARLRTRRRRMLVSVVIVLVVIGPTLAWVLSGGTSGPSSSRQLGGGDGGTGVGNSSNSTAASVFTAPPLSCGTTDMVASGSHLWLVGCTFKTRSMYSARVESVVELNARTGSLVRIIDAKADRLYYPNGIAAGSRHVWVTNDNGTVTELNVSNGSLVRVISAKADGFAQSTSIELSGTHVWIANATSITELNVSSGSLVRVIKSTFPGEGFSDIAVSGSHLWLPASTTDADAVIERNANTGAVERVVRGALYGFNLPMGIAVQGPHVWVTSSAGPLATTPQADSDPYTEGGSVTEFNANTGAVERVIASKPDDFFGSAGITIDGSQVWVANSSSNSLTELNARTGSLIRVVKTKGDGFQGGPVDVVASGSHLWLLNTAFSISSGSDVWGSLLTELNVSNGAVVREFR